MPSNDPETEVSVLDNIENSRGRRVALREGPLGGWPRLRRGGILLPRKSYHPGDKARDGISSGGAKVVRLQASVLLQRAQCGEPLGNY